MNKSHFSCLKPVLYFLLPMLITLSFFRLAFVLWQFDRVAEAGDFAFVFLQGLRFDLVIIGMLLLLPATLLPLMALSGITLRLALLVTRLYLIFLSGFIVFLELATPNFVLQFDFRPNILFVEYLNSPKEVFGMLIKAVPAQLVAAILLTLAAVWAMNKWLCVAQSNIKQSYWFSAPVVALLACFTCFLAARSTLDHRAVNPSIVAFSSDPLVNSLPLSSAYTVLYAVYEKMKYEKGNNSPYGEMPYADAVSEVQNALGLPGAVFTDESIPTLHRNDWVVPNKGRPKNLVIVLEESLGADYVGSLGGLAITPHLDALSKQGIWFDNLYATGTRSVRGIEAVITGFLPTPMRSVVKLGGSQHNFFTIAELLGRQDYATSFIYGGEAHFDNMKRFFSNNGFQTIIDENDFVSPEFYGSWGASDGDLFNKANDVFIQQYNQGKPFFSLVFSSSNHSPFDFPDNKIELYEQPKATVANAVKYADYALGAFIEKAKKSVYWRDTIFLIIADHSDRVFGSELVPIERFRIPALILNSGQQPKVISRVASQMDMPPTLLSMMGVAAQLPALGIDFTRPDLDEIPPRAIMQYGGNQAYMERDEVVVLQKNAPPQHFFYRDKKLVENVNPNPALVKKALAHGQWPLLAYKNKSYKLPAVESPVASH